MSFNFASEDNTQQSKAEHRLEDMFLQTLEKRYVKKQALLEFLDNNFGSTGYEVEFQGSFLRTKLSPCKLKQHLDSYRRPQLILTALIPVMSIRAGHRVPRITNKIRDGLVASKKENYEAAWYIPWSKLSTLLDERNVKEAIDESGVEPYERDEAVRTVLRGGKKVFATLVLINSTSSITKFLERDNLQHQELDARLPYPTAVLVSVLGQTEGQLFYRDQWMVSVPVFRADLSHRSFDRSIVLPFIFNKKKGGGASGEVYETRIDPEHQLDITGANSSSDLLIVRKVIDLDQDGIDDVSLPNDTDAPRSEGHVLSMLRLIRHPNIVQLISSYTFRGSYNLLFERAESDLNGLLSKSERPFGLRTNNSLFQALQGLCSAIAAFHRFAHPELELYLKGFHHDLKPENILVNGSRFLLSDFGLSKLKDMDMTSKTLSKDIIGYYLSPESETIEDGFQKKLIGQPSDIWALGCILSVVLTFIQRGSSGVEKFEQKRRHKSRSWTAYTFHCAGKPNPNVEEWLDTLKEGGNPEVCSLITLIRDMLKIDPSERPTAETVLTRIEFSAVQSEFNTTMRKFKRVETTPQDLTIWIEKERMKSLGQALRLDLPSQEWRNIQQSTITNTEFETVRDLLTALGRDLDSWAEHTDTTSYPIIIVKRIRNQVNQLWNYLLPAVRAKLDASLEAQIVSTKDLVRLENIQKSFGEDISYRNLGLATAVRSMIIRANRNENKNPELKWDANRIHKTVPEITPFSSLAELTNADGKPQMEVLVEWLEYDSRWQGPTGDELASRIESIAGILHDEANCKRFRSLRCIKYFHDSSCCSYGLAFEIPTRYRTDISLGQHSSATSLASLITSTRKERIRPSIGDAFRLAEALTSSVLTWHEFGWIHRRISAHSVIFFGINPDAPLLSILEPSFLGFQFSRPNDPKAFTLGPTDRPELLDYCHPEYLKDSKRNRPEFDYYSLGLVLLEIGYWKSIKDITKGFKDPGNSPEDLRTWMLQEPVGDLHMVMGSIYQSAVRKCLTFPSNQDLEADGVVPLNVQEEFRTNVLEKIQLCFA